MAAAQELQVQKKREVENKEETTIPARMFVPAADIYEGEHNFRSGNAGCRKDERRCSCRRRRFERRGAARPCKSIKACSHSIQNTT